MTESLTGRIDLMQFTDATLMKTNRGTDILVIPLDRNALKVEASTDRDGKQSLAVNMNVNIIARKEMSKKGFTHFATQYLFKEFVDDPNNKEIVEAKNKTFFGNFKPLEKKDDQVVENAIASAPVLDTNDDLPF